MEREKIVKGLLQHCEGSMFDRCWECPYYEVADEPFQCRDALLMDVFTFLKEQEAVKPVRDKLTGRIWLCGNCGTYVGFEDNDPHDPNEFDKHCRECGRPVLWEGR